jgi:glutamate-1-semialdehyde 2,1-aminomutase
MTDRYEWLMSTARGSGPYVWDQHDRRYVDWVCGLGPVVLGHGHPAVVEAVTDSLRSGNLFPGGRSRTEHALADRITSLFPGSDRCHFLKTGSEAVAWAVRLARRATGRRAVLRVGFHGWHDGLAQGQAQWNDWDWTEVVPGTEPGGLDLPEFYHPAGSQDLVSHLEDLLNRGFAGVLLDPIQLRHPERDLLQVRQACDRAGTLLILDETKTAFRIAMGGVQELTGVRADLTVAGKAMANGLPISSVVGPTELLGRQARAKGTFSSEQSAIAASLATLSVLDERDGCVRIAETGSRLIDGLNGVLAGHPVGQYLRAVPYRWPAMPHVHAPRDNPIAQECRTAVLRATAVGGALLLDRHASFVGLSHGEEEVEMTIDVFGRAADAWTEQELGGP